MLQVDDSVTAAASAPVTHPGQPIAVPPAKQPAADADAAAALAPMQRRRLLQGAAAPPAAAAAPTGTPNATSAAAYAGALDVTFTMLAGLDSAITLNGQLGLVPARAALPLFAMLALGFQVRLQEGSSRLLCHGRRWHCSSHCPWCEVH